MEKLELSAEISKPAGAVSVMSPVSSLPLTVKGLEVDALPMFVVKAARPAGLTEMPGP